MRFVLAPCPCLFDSTQEPCVRQQLLRSSFFFEIPQLRNVCKLAALVSRRRVHTAGMSPRLQRHFTSFLTAFPSAYWRDDDRAALYDAYPFR